MTVLVKDNEEMLRYEISFDGELVGFVEYERGPGSIAFLYTEIDPRYRGRGFGHRLVAHAVETSREAGLSIEPQCAFVRTYVDRHPAVPSAASRQRLGGGASDAQTC